jgi:hypothetical protein
MTIGRIERHRLHHLINMSHQQFILAYDAVPLGYLISIRKALRILIAHKAREARFQSLLAKSVCALLAMLGAGFCGFVHLPMFLAASTFALGGSFFGLLVWLQAGDILLQFALEDQQFFELATGCRALSIFHDPELSLPQPKS